MGRSTANFAVALLTMGWLGLDTSLSRAHEGHDHGAPPPPVSATVAPRAEDKGSLLDKTKLIGIWLGHGDLPHSILC